MRLMYIYRLFEFGGGKKKELIYDLIKEYQFLLLLFPQNKVKKLYPY